MWRRQIPLRRYGVLFTRQIPAFPPRRDETMKMHTYINFPGTCKDALQFYEKHLGGKIR